MDKLASAGVEVADLFLSDDYFKGCLLEKLQVLHFDFAEEEKLIKALKETLQAKAQQADKSLVMAVEAEITKTTKAVAELEKRLNKALENRYETDLNKLQNLRRKLFPDGDLQERHDNFLQFYLQNTDFIDSLHAAFHPFAFQMECLVR